MIRDRIRARTASRRGPSKRWRFRGTGREAVVDGVESTAEIDTVVFRFVDDFRPRRIAARRFLADFERIGKAVQR